jgi:hypothetical protein
MSVKSAISSSCEVRITGEPAGIRLSEDLKRSRK